MESKVQGRWKQFEFRMIKPQDYPRVLDHLHKNFYLSNPLTRGFEYSKEYFDDFDRVYFKILPHNLSFCAIDTLTNEIAGLRITYINSKALEQELANLGYKSRQMRIINKIMFTLNRNSQIYERFGIDSFITFYTACVDPKFRGQGLATEMYKRALAFVRSNEKFNFVKSNITSPFTLKICQKFGFQELNRVYYNDFRDEEDHNLLKYTSDEEFVAFMCLELG